MSRVAAWAAVLYLCTAVVPGCHLCHLLCRHPRREFEAARLNYPNHPGIFLRQRWHPRLLSRCFCLNSFVYPAQTPPLSMHMRACTESPYL